MKENIIVGATEGNQLPHLLQAILERILMYTEPVSTLLQASVRA